MKRSGGKCNGSTFWSRTRKTKERAARDQSDSNEFEIVNDSTDDAKKEFEAEIDDWQDMDELD